MKRSMALQVRDATWLPDDRAASEYEATFARAAIGKMSDEPVSVAQRIGASEIEQSLVAALDDWAVCESDEARRNWVLAVARHAGGAGRDWENQYRDPESWSDRDVLSRLAETASIARPSVQQLRALGDRLAAAGIDA